MDALAVFLTVAVTAVVLFVPGGVAAAIVGFRGIGVLGAAAPLSLAGIALLSLTEIVLPLAWTPVTWVVSAALVILVALLLRRITREDAWDRSSERSLLHTISPFVAVAIGAAAIAARLIPIMGGEQISQTFDNIYHLNAVRYILDTGLVGPTHQIIPGFYPSLWHAMTATVAMISGASIPLAVNITSIALAAVVWPASVVFLTRQIIGPSSTASLLAGVLSAAMAGFPLLMLDHGVLYPNVLSIALLPAVLALLVQVTRTGDDDRAPAVTRWVVLLVSIAVLALAHPSTLMAFFAIGAWPALAGGIRWFTEVRRRPERRRLAWGLSFWVVGVVAVAALLLVARPTREQAFWLASLSVQDATTQVLLGSVAWKPVNLAVSVVVLVAVLGVFVFRRRWWWLVAGWATIAVLFIVCASFPDGRLRYLLTGTWYSDLFRIAALLPAVIVPLAAVGATLVLTAALRAVRGRRDLVLSVTGAVVAAVVLLVTQTSAHLGAATASASAVYRITDQSPLLTSSEEALLKRLPAHVPADEVIAGSPWTGTALSYALADRRALIPHIYQEPTEDIALLSARLNEAAISPEICAALDRTRTRWVLDFGHKEVHGAEHPYPGFFGLDEADGFELVDEEGTEARLFRITACG